MTTKKPNLTIEIQQLGQQFNSKFKGYVQQPSSSKSQNQNQYQYQSHIESNYVPGVEIKNSYISQRSQNSRVSGDSRGSERSLLLGRAEQVILQNRLAQNVRSLSKGKWKKAESGRKAVGIGRVKKEENERSQGSDYGDLEMRKKFLHQKKQIVRSKSATGLEHSRAKILQQIAQKLGKVSRVHTSNDEQNHSFIGNSQIHNEQSQTKSQVEKIKQIKQQMQKARGGKLEHLMKDIKKSNKESYKVIYTIKKSIKSSGKKHATSPLTDRMAETEFKSQLHTRNGHLSPNGNLFNNSQQQYDMNQGYMNSQFSNLALELQNVRLELKEVKNRNDQLLQMSKNGKFRNNQDQGSQSSRLTNKILEFDLTSLDSSTKNNGTYYTNTNNQSSFVKGLPYSMQYSAGERQGQGFHVVRQPIMLQACFACGCTCMRRGK